MSKHLVPMPDRLADIFISRSRLVFFGSLAWVAYKDDFSSMQRLVNEHVSSYLALYLANFKDLDLVISQEVKTKDEWGYIPITVTARTKDSEEVVITLTIKIGEINQTTITVDTSLSWSAKYDRYFTKLTEVGKMNINIKDYLHVELWDYCSRQTLSFTVWEIEEDLG